MLNLLSSLNAQANKDVWGNYTHTLVVRAAIVLSAFISFASTSSVLSADGLLWSDADLAAWQERAVLGPYVKAGDAFDSKIPGEWERIEGEAAAFRSNPSADRKSTVLIDTGATGGEGIVQNHIGMLGAAFYALVKDDAVLKRLVVDELVWHANQSGLQISPTTYLKTDNGNWWQAGWFARIVVAADFVKDEFTPSERIAFEAWVGNWANAYESSVDYELSRWLFTNRKDRNYSSGGPYMTTPSYDTYAYMDANGNKKNLIDRSHKHYNNRKAGVMQFVGLFAVFSQDDLLIDRSKLYFEEWLKFNVFADGSSGEYERNDDNGRNIQQGFLYNARNIEAYVTTADALARHGDTSLYDLSTREGIFGTESAAGQDAKTLRMTVETYFDLTEGDKAWYNSDYSVDERYRIDHIANIDGANKAGTQWVNEIWFAPIANRYWKDEGILESYTRQAPGSVGYSDTLGTAGPFGAPWRGHQAIFPSIYFMFSEMESVLGSYPNEAPGDVTPPVDEEPEPEEPIVEDPSNDLPPFAIVYAADYDSDFLPLDGATISDQVFVSVKPDATIAAVDFYDQEDSNDSFVNQELYAPYDYIWQKTSIGPEDLADANRIIVAVVTQKDGTIYRLEATVSSEASEEDVVEEEVSDNDRLPDEWETLHFGAIDSVLGAEDEDFDGDLVSNYDEWLAGTDPTDAADYLSLKPVLGVTWKSQLDRSYRIEYTDNNWASFSLSDLLDGNGETIVWVDPTANDVLHNRQYRIVIVNN
ncbi:hypothetical protein ACWPKO_01260 [Coraliomargarita sp. W4R53]